MNYSISADKAKELIENKLSHFFGVTPENATYDHYYRSVVMILNEMMGQGRAEFTKRGDESNSKRVYYLSM